MTRQDAVHVEPSQLCIGLHVHLDLPWTDHPFTFSSFKIKSLEQVALLQSLGLERIRISPAKSDCQPLPAQAQGAAPAPPAAPDAVFESKRERIRRLVQQRARIEACEREFVASSKAVKAIDQNLFARPDQARQQAAQVIGVIADSMLTDAEVAINLMKDKIGGEDMFCHALNVTVLSMMLAKELKAPQEAIRLLGTAALFHDVGKHDIPERILRKTDALTRPELALLQQHCAYGVEIGRNKLALTPEALNVIAQHHEHVDGSGYPKGLAGAEISMLARIVAVVNTFDNLCNPPNPARALTPHEALSTMYGQQRARFEALPLNTFIRCMGIYPPGTVVVLSNDSIALVTSVNSERPLKPTVLVYDPAVPREEAILVELEHEPEVSVVRTLKPQDLPESVAHYLSPRARLAYYFDSQRAGAP